MPTFISENIPSSLKGLNNWICWQSEARNGKPTKVPYTAGVAQKRASVDDPSTWTSYKRAVRYSESYDGIGFVLDESLGLVGIDLDKCIENGVLEPWAQAIVTQMDSYCEITPSGTGVHIWCYGRLSEGRRRKACFEIYSHLRYLTVTGNILPGCRATIEPRQSEIDALMLAMLPLEAREEKSPLRVVPELDWSDQELLDKMFSASNGPQIEALWLGDNSGYASASEADAALMCHLAFYCGPSGHARADGLFRQSGRFRPKWDERHRSDGATYGQITIESCFAKTTEFYETSDYAELPSSSIVTQQPSIVTLDGASTGSRKTRSKQVDKKTENGHCHTVTPICGNDVKWGPLCPIRQDVMVPVPLEALPFVLADYVRDVSNVIQVPPDLPALAGLSVLSFAVCRRFDVRIRASYTETTNLYTAAAMEPGSRKSAALENMVFPLRAYEKLLINSNREERREREELRKASEERLSKRRRDLAAEKDPTKRDEIAGEILTLRAEVEQIESDPRLLVEDVTPEKLVGLLMEQHGTMALVSSEGGVFGTIGGRYSEGQSNLDVYLKAHDGESYKVDRLNRPSEYIEAARLAICLTVQPNVLHSLSKKREFRGRGLLGRFLYAIPADWRGRRMMNVNAPGLDPEIRHEYGEAIRALLAIPPADNGDPYARHMVTLSKEALKIHADLANRIESDQREGGDLRPFSDWASKLAGNAARIAAGFHCLEYRHEQPHTIPISEETILQAWAVAEYLKEHAVRAFDMMTESDNARAACRVLEIVARKRMEHFSSRDCQRWNQKQFDQKSVDSALMLLALNNYVRQVEPPAGSGSRAGKHWQVNPEYFSTLQIGVTV